MDFLDVGFEGNQWQNDKAEETENKAHETKVAIVGQVFRGNTSEGLVEPSSNHGTKNTIGEIPGTGQEREYGCLNSWWSNLCKKSHSWQNQHCHNEAAEHNISENYEYQVTDSDKVVPSHGQCKVNKGREHGQDRGVQYYGPRFHVF